MVMRSLGGIAPLRPRTDAGRMAGPTAAIAAAPADRLRKRLRLIAFGIIPHYRMNHRHFAKPIHRSAAESAPQSAVSLPAKTGREPERGVLHIVNTNVARRRAVFHSCFTAGAENFTGTG
jgi:hypothetical protein